jgi:tetratricopeptide (TPR) repeat protein
VAVLFSLAVGTAVSSYFAVTAGRRAEEAERHRERADNETREAVREKQRADANYRRAREAVQQYLTLVSQEQRLKEADFFVLRKKLLDTALPLYRELLAQVRDDPALVAERREALTTLADIEGQIGNVGEATRAYRELLTLLRKQVAQQPGDQVLRAKCILTHANLGIYLHRQGKLTEAEQLLRQGLELAQQYATDQPHDTEALVTLARGKAVLTHVVADLNQPAEAERLLREEISTYAGLARQYPKKPALWEELGHAQTELGTHLIRQGRLADAEKEYLAGRRFWEQEGKTLTSQPARQAVAGLTYQLSKLYTDQGRWTESERENKACLAMLEPLTQEFPSITRYRLLLGLARTNYAFVLEHSQRLAEAEQQLVQAQQLIAPLAPPDGLDIKPRQELGRVHQLLGGLKLRRGQPQEAQQHYRQALAIYLDLTQRFPALAELQHELAAVYLQTGNLAFQGHNFDAAMREYRQCLALLEKLVAANPTNLNHQIQMGGCLCNMGHISMERGHLEDALRWYDRAARILGNVLHRDGRSRMARQFLRNVQLSRTRVLLQLQRPLEALDASEQAYTLDDGTLKALLHQQQRRMVQQLLHQGEEYLQRGEKPQLFILVERLAKMAALAPDQAFTAANLCAGALAETTTTPADRFTNLALTFLAKAQQVGYFQRQGQRGLILSLPAFATLRLRPEFATWLREQK